MKEMESQEETVIMTDYMLRGMWHKFRVFMHVVWVD